MKSENALPTATPTLSREAALQPIRAVLEKARSVLSIAHPYSDGDALGSQLALHFFCKSQGKRSVCLNFDPLPDSLQWLTGVNELVSDLPADEEFDVLFLMETTDISRMGTRASYFSKAKTRVHLDHHLEVKGLGHLNYLDPSASSTCEILFDLLKPYKSSFRRETYESLYVGIMTDTGNFRFSNTTRRAHEIAGEIIEAGIPIAEIFKRVYECNSFCRTLIHGIILARAEENFNGRIIHSWLTLPDFERTGATQVDADGAINHFCTVRGAEVAILFREEADGAIKVSFRSTGRVDVQSIGKAFGGGGHRQAAGAKLSGPIHSAIQRVLSLMEPAIAALEE